MAGKVLVPISEHINRLVAIRLQYDIMGVSNLVVARTDSEVGGGSRHGRRIVPDCVLSSAQAATLITSNVDERDHAFILGNTNPSLKPLASVMTAAEKQGLSGAALQSIEDKWTASAQLELWAPVLAKALAKQGVAAARCKAFLGEVAGTAHASHAEALRIATESYGLRAANVPFWDWDGPRTREGFYRYQGGTQCAINRAVEFAPYADLLWMETKSPIYAQAKEFAEGVHAKRPGHWLAYNLSPSFNWDAAGLNETDMKEYVWK